MATNAKAYGKKKPIKIKKSHKGLLHKDTDTPLDQKIPKAKIAAAKNSPNPAVRKRATFAQNFNDNGHHGEVTSVSRTHNGKYVELEVAHGRRRVKPKDGDNSVTSNYDDRPRSRVVLPRSEGGNYSVGQRVGVGASPLVVKADNDGDEPDADDGYTGPPKQSAPPAPRRAQKGGKRGKRKSAPKKASAIGAAMGAGY